ncbi:hypothetical protein C8R45DRAFT_966690 [Mycena sanguinolenta]|nr:hypothetical protein C8R45DRAFT_966690 [Mycena sanguinolenta]
MRIKELILSARIALDEGKKNWEYCVARENETHTGLVSTWVRSDSFLEADLRNATMLHDFWRSVKDPRARNLKDLRKWEVGEEVKPATNVYARRPKTDSDFYAAVVQAKLKNEKYLVSFYDGVVTEVKMHEMRKDELRVGDWVLNLRNSSTKSAISKIEASTVTTGSTTESDRTDIAIPRDEILKCWGDRMFQEFEDDEIVCMYGN